MATGTETFVSRGWRRASTLEARFTLFVAALLLIFGLLATVLVVDASRRQSIQEMRDRTEFYGRRAVDSFAPAMLTQNYAALGDMLQRQASGPNVISAAVVDANGKTVSARWGPARHVSTRTVAPVSLQIKSSEGRVLGTLTYYMASEKVAASSMRGLTAALAGLAFFIALSIPLTLVMVRGATEPLRRLTAFAEQLNAQKLTEQIEIKSGDEFETLALAFNNMVSRLNAAMRRMQRIAFVDQATNLPNADRLLTDARRAIDAAARAGVPGALFLLGMDRAARATDSLGEEAGRELIVAAARRLCTAVKDSNPWNDSAAPGRADPIVARVGASEFAVLYPALPRGVAPPTIAQALVLAFDAPFSWREHRIAMPCSLGGAFFPRDGQDAETVMRHARLALHSARSSSEGLKFFTRSLDREATAKLTLEREIRAALERGEFKAFFQPKVNLRTGRIEGAEALARWVKADQSIVSPGKFIPAAEEMGLIGPISEQILRDACWKAAAWSREGLPARVAVNVSSLQFADDNFPTKVLKIADEAGLPTQCLELEITESIAMEDIDRALQMIEPLRERGVRFSIDDFGTGHSSLSALTRLPFEVLKIDQSFVRGLSQNTHSAAIIETILAMAAALNFEVVAEGVETEAEAEFLRRRGCPIAQGFLYSAAQPPEVYLQMLREGAIKPVKSDKPAPGNALDPAA